MKTLQNDDVTFESLYWLDNTPRGIGASQKRLKSNYMISKDLEKRKVWARSKPFSRGEKKCDAVELFQWEKFLTGL